MSEPNELATKIARAIIREVPTEDWEAMRHRGRSDRLAAIIAPHLPQSPQWQGIGHSIECPMWMMKCECPSVTTPPDASAVTPCPHLHQDYPGTPVNKCLDCGAAVTPPDAPPLSEILRPAYDAAAIRLHGEFACLNFPVEAGEEKP